MRADGWLGDLLSGAAAQSLQPLAPPPEFTAMLRPYQQRGLSWLAFLSSLGLGSCLADDMGLGKTVQLLALESAQRHDQPGAAPTLLLCPMSLVGNWQREAAKFAPTLRVYAHHGTARLRGDALREHLADTDVVVTTYATATRDIDELAGFRVEPGGAGRGAGGEEQSVPRGQGGASARGGAPGGAYRDPGREPARRAVVDHGLPQPRSARLVRACSAPGTRSRSSSTARPSRPSGCAAITRPYLLRRLKTDPTIIDDLPEKIEIKQYCQLTTEQASLYQSIVDDMMEKIENTEGIERRGNVLAAMAKLKQVCNHPAQLLHDRSPVGARSGKVIRLEEILEEILAEGDWVLCFTQFTEFAEMLRAAPGRAVRAGRGLPARRHPEEAARRDGGALPVR